MSEIDNLQFTVFTPTYNRAHTLTRVYKSLCKQPPDIFEWLVIDDGSTDNTESLIRELAASSRFPVRYFHQPNGGKHRAHNEAVQLACGVLTVILDSDDELTEGALLALWQEWQAIPFEKRHRYSSIIGHSVDDKGCLVGKPYPRPCMDGHYFELSATGAMCGEKLPCYRTDVLRRFPFPELPGSTDYVPESVVWAEIGIRFLTRCVNISVRVYHREPGDESAIMNLHKSPKKGAWGKMTYSHVLLNKIAPIYFPRFALMFLKAAINTTRYGLHCGYGFQYQMQNISTLIGKLLLVVGLPAGVALYFKDLRT
ncbi:MAG: glycosyltransferase family A protein [Thermodesulfobacteriota bacterium]